MANAPLRGRRALVVEDESLVAMLVEDMLLDLGAKVEVAMRLCEAVRQAREGVFDFAILDVNLGDGDRSDAMCSRHVVSLLSLQRATVNAAWQLDTLPSQRFRSPTTSTISNS